MGGGRRRRWTDDQLLLAVREARSMADACRRLGLSPKGGNRFTVAARVQALGLPTDHWTGQGWRRGLRQAVPRRGRPLAELLVVHPLGFRGANPHDLKRRLIAEGIVGPGCQGEGCGITTWLGRPLVLQLDHINGDRNDWRPENLRLLCPNCHAQTETHSGRNRRARMRG
jgi:hypothetical protein